MSNIICHTNESCCYTVKVENSYFLPSTQMLPTLYYFIYKINLISHDYNPNNKFHPKKRKKKMSGREREDEKKKKKKKEGGKKKGSG
jgi:hypothetical protein